jgi:hypothetical protein
MPVRKTIGMVVVAAFAASAGTRTAATIYGYAAADEIGCKRRQPIDLILRMSVLDRHAQALDIAGWAAPSSRRVDEDVATLIPHSPECADFPLPVLHGRASLADVVADPICTAARF